MESPFNRGKSTFAAPARPATPNLKAQPTISCRATNPLSLQDDLGKVFLDEQQAKATTATRLFRNDELFNALTKVVLPSYFANNKTGKFGLWSTGCSSGEEVYSLAMVAMAEFERAKRPMLLECFGTDINTNRILEARAGEYTKPSKDALSQNYQRMLANYAQMTDHEVIMGPQLKTICKFTLFDMRKCPKKHTFHFIVCNHVLQYYDAPGQKVIIGNLKAVLKPGGFLYLEGITEHGLDGSGLRKMGTAANMYVVEDKPASGLTRRLSNPFFKKQ